MPRFVVGQPVTLATTVRDPAGQLVDPGGISVQLRNSLTGATTTYGYPGQVVRDSVGTFHLDLAGLAAGLYPGAWVTTGDAAGLQQFLLNVVDPFTPTHISYEDARARLNLSAVSDDEVQDMIASAVAEQEHWVGAVAPRQVVETVTAYAGQLWLSTRPVLSVTTATTLAAASVSTSGWVVGSPLAGTVGIPDGPLRGTFVVTYVAGRSPVPQDLVEAALLRVQHSYATQRPGGGGQIIGSASGDAEAGTDSSFLLKLRWEDKEGPYVLPAVA